MGDAFEVANSRGNPPEQKAIFKYRGYNVAELEMRNDSRQHYQEIRFNMIVPKAMELLLTIEPARVFSENVTVYGGAFRTFGNWQLEWREA